MKNVTLVVEICVTVSDDVDADMMHLNNGLEDFTVMCGGEPIPDANVTGYTTVAVHNDSENNDEFTD